MLIPLICSIFRGSPGSNGWSFGVNSVEIRCSIWASSKCSPVRHREPGTIGVKISPRHRTRRCYNRRRYFWMFIQYCLTSGFCIIVHQNVLSHRCSNCAFLVLSQGSDKDAVRTLCAKCYLTTPDS